MKTITRKLINKISEEICDEEILSQKNLPRVFENGGKVYVTATPFFLFSVDKDKIDDVSGIPYHSLMSIKYGSDCLAEWSPEKIRKILGKEPPKLVVDTNCPECNGNGVVEVEYESVHENMYGESVFTFEVDCPICHGTGKTPDACLDNEFPYFSFKGCEFAYKFEPLKKVIPLIGLLNTEKVVVERNSEHLLLRFMDGVRFVISGRLIVEEMKNLVIVDF